MKLNLFLSVVSLFALLHLSKAGPLRLHKRAAFYIANETACVVDNIVYSNGEPIPTDDPCEACKCRPPGFACVLKECKVKPGCKAVRRVGECCPDYICDVPENNQFPRGDALLSVNLLPVLNDESVLPVDFPSSSSPSSQTPELSEKSPDPTQPTLPANSNETPAPLEPGKIPGEPQIAESVSLAPEENAEIVPEVKDQNVEVANVSNQDEKEDLLKDESNEEKEIVEANEETKAVFNSETEIKKEDKNDLTPVKVDPTELSVEGMNQEEPQTTVSSELVEDKSTEVTEKSPENEPISTKLPESEKQIRNSAAENGKSLKIEDSKEDEEIKTEEPKTELKLDEAITESVTELQSETQTEISKENSTERKPEIEENTSEQNGTNPPAIYSNDKIKSETAETVTIVVHVREKSTPSTEISTPSTEKPSSSTEEAVPSTEKVISSSEKDSVTEKVTVSEASTTQENLLKSNEELQVTEVNEKSTKDEVTTIGKNFEIFPSSTEISKSETTTNPPLTTQSERKIEGRSDEIDSTKDGVKNPTTGESVTKNEDTSVPVTTQNVDEVTDERKITTSEIIDKTTTNEPTAVTLIKISPNATIKLINPAVVQEVKDHDTTKESENKETENKEIENKSEINSETKDELKSEEKLNLEAREEESATEKKIEETSTVKVEETTPAVKLFTSTERLEETTQPEKVNESTSAGSIPEKDQTLEETEKAPVTPEAVEKLTTEDAKIADLEKNTSDKTTELKKSGTEE